MELRKEIFSSLGVLVVLNILSAFGAIGLFVRMGPAIGQIMDRNVFSIEAAEDMLVELAAAGDRPLTPEARTRFEQALARIEGNVTETAEGEEIDRLRQHLEPTMAGWGDARLRSIGSLRSLIAVNREAMKKADGNAVQLGGAGAWASVFMGLLSFMVGLSVLARFRRRLLLPMMELFNVLDRAGEGDRYRRCHVGQAPAELKDCMRKLNRLLDRGFPAADADS